MKPSDCIAIIKDATIYITEHKDHYLDIFILYAEVHSTQDSLSDVAKNYSDLFTQIFVQMQFLARHQKVDDILIKKNIQKMQLILENIPKTIKLSKHQKLDIVSGIVYLKSFIKILTCDVFSDLLKSTSSMNSFHSSTQESNISDIDILSYGDTKSFMSASKLSGTVNSKSSKSGSLVLTGGMANNVSDCSEQNTAPSMINISSKHTVMSSDNYGELTKLTHKYRNENDNEREYDGTSKYNIRNEVNTNFSEDTPFTSFNYTNDNPDDHIQKHYEKRNKNKYTNESTTTKITELKTNDSLYDNENKNLHEKYPKFDKNKYNKSKNKHVIERIDECDENFDSFKNDSSLSDNKHSSSSSDECADDNHGIYIESPKKRHKSPKKHKQRDAKTQTKQPKEHNAKTQTKQPKEHNAKTQTVPIELRSESTSSSENTSSEKHYHKSHRKKHHHVICDVSGNVLNGTSGVTTINNTNNNNNNNSGGTSTTNTTNTTNATNNTTTVDASGYLPTILTGTGNATLVVNTTTISIDQILKIYSLKILKQIEAIEFVITSTIKILSEIKRDFLAKINCLEMYSITSNLDLAEIEYHNNLLNTLYNQLSVILLQTDSDGHPIFNNMNQTITITLNLGSGGTYQLFTIDNIYAMYLSTQMDIIVGSGDYTFLLFQNNITVSNAITIYKASFLNVKNAIFALNANKKILCQWKDMITMKCF